MNLDDRNLDLRTPRQIVADMRKLLASGMTDQEQADFDRSVEDDLWLTPEGEGGTLNVIYYPDPSVNRDLWIDLGGQAGSA